MHIEINSTLDYITEHGLQDKYFVVDNHNWYWVITENVNDELWFNVFHNQNFDYVWLDYEFSSRDLKECLDYCNISYYEDAYWQFARA